MRLDAANRLCTGASTVLLFGFSSCLVVACLSNVAQDLAPGIWGYVAAAAVLAAMAPMPAKKT